MQRWLCDKIFTIFCYSNDVLQEGELAATTTSLQLARGSEAVPLNFLQC